MWIRHCHLCTRIVTWNYPFSPFNGFSRKNKSPKFWCDLSPLEEEGLELLWFWVHVYPWYPGMRRKVSIFYHLLSNLHCSSSLNLEYSTVSIKSNEFKYFRKSKTKKSFNIVYKEKTVCSVFLYFFIFYNILYLSLWKIWKYKSHSYL